MRARENGFIFIRISICKCNHIFTKGKEGHENRWVFDASITIQEKAFCSVRICIIFRLRTLYVSKNEYAIVARGGGGIGVVIRIHRK